MTSPAVAVGLAQFPVFGPGVRTQGKGAICFGLKLNLPRDRDRCSDLSAGRLLFQCRVKFPALGFPGYTPETGISMFKLFAEEKETQLLPRHGVLQDKG